MNKMTQTALAALVLGACSTVIYAGGEDKGSQPSGPSGCSVDCEGKIDIELKVDPHCELQVLTPKIVLEDKAGGDTKNGSFKVGANAVYKIELSTANNSNLKMGTNSIPIAIKTTRSGTVIPMGVTPNQPFTLGGWTAYNVEVKSPEVGVTKPVGTYTEQYRIKVSF